MQSFLAIADPTRRRIVELLAQRDRTAGELVVEFDVSASAISLHLNVLREAAVITRRAEGPVRVQSLNLAGLGELDNWLNRTREFWSHQIDVFEYVLRAEDDRLTNASRKTHSRVALARLHPQSAKSTLPAPAS